MTRLFGVELEWIGNMADVLRELRAAGLDTVDSRHTHSTGIAPSGWAVKRDGSVRDGGELVSPPLDFDNWEERAQLTTAVECLQRAGARPSPQAGIHVHIEAKNFDGSEFTGKQVAAVVRFFYKFEDAIYRIASSGWQSIRPGARTYAKPVPEETARKIMKVRTQEQLRKVWGESGAGSWRNTHDRYHAVNLQSYFYRGTIEFRCFNSSVNPVRVQTYLAFCMAMVDDARHGHSRSVAKSYRLGAMHSGEVSADALFLRLQQVLRCPVGDGTKSNGQDRTLMSEEDWKNLRKVCWKDSVPQRNLFRSGF